VRSRGQAAPAAGSYDHDVPVTVAVILMVAGVLVAATALVVAVWAGLDRPLRVAARGGVVGREGRGVLLRDGDGLVFVRRMRRYLLPLQPEPDQAVRRLTRGQGRELLADVFRGPDHVVHTVAALDDRDVARLTSAAGVRRRVTPRALVPRVAAAVFALGVVPTVPWLGVWLTGVTVDATVTNHFLSPEGWDCTVTWPAADESVRRQDVECADEAAVGQGMAVRALAPPFDGAILAFDDGVVRASVVGVVSFVGLAGLVGRAVLTMRRRSVTLWPMTASVPGFDGSMPNDERRRARLLPLYDLAQAVQQAERHGDVEDNDLFRSRGRALWSMLRGPVLAGLAAVPFCALYGAAVMQSAEYGVVTAGLGLVLVVVLVVRRVRRTRAGMTQADGWTTWNQAAAWRRFDGQVFAVLFDAGGAVWWIPVDRVFAPGARVEIGGRLERDALCSLRANSVDLLTLGPTERLSPADAVALREELVRALLASTRRASAAQPQT
jgi:hypothetical protein